MLQQEPSSQETLTPAQMRVTPEELARAIASLEAKKAEEAHSTEGTVTLGEAVESLCLDATPDELLAEIQRHRAAGQPQEEEIQPFISLDNLPRTRFPSEAEVFRPLLIALAVIVFAFIGIASFQAPPENHPEVQWSEPIAPAPTMIIKNSSFTLTPPDADFYNKLRLSEGLNPQYRIVLVGGLALRHLPPDETCYPFSAVPDGYSVYAGAGPTSFGALLMLIAGNQSVIVFQKIGEVDPTPFDPLRRNSPFVIITRYDGREYLRCWVQRNDVAALKKGRPVGLYTFRPADGLPSQLELVPLTIPLKPTQEPVGGSGNSRMVSLFVGSLMRYGQTYPFPIVTPGGITAILDKHAWEKW